MSRRDIQAPMSRGVQVPPLSPGKIPDIVDIVDIGDVAAPSAYQYGTTTTATAKACHQESGHVDAARQKAGQL
jgi:hypothetical protein